MSWKVAILLHLAVLIFGTAGLGYFLFEVHGRGRSESFFEYLWLFLALSTMLSAGGALGQAAHIARAIAKRENLNTVPLRTDVTYLVAYVLCGAAVGAGCAFLYFRL